MRVIIGALSIVCSHALCPRCLGHLPHCHQVPGALPGTLACLHLARVAAVGDAPGGGVIFIFCCHCHKGPQAGWLKTTETYSLSVLKARSPESAGL